MYTMRLTKYDAFYSTHYQKPIIYVCVEKSTEIETELCPFTTSTSSHMIINNQALFALF
jgi:hypothetical protein